MARFLPPTRDIGCKKSKKKQESQESQKSKSKTRTGKDFFGGFVFRGKQLKAKSKKWRIIEQGYLTEQAKSRAKKAKGKPGLEQR